MSTFNIDRIPTQHGRIAVVTGANAGLGFETARMLAGKDMKVIMACRNFEKASKAKEAILRQVPGADLEVMQLDLSKLDSVRSFAKMYFANHQKLDLLINNAGIMMCPYEVSEDGFEMQMAANYFGHYLLTGLLLKTLLDTEGSRIVSLSSNAHKRGRINFEDIQSKQHYSKIGAYSQSKLACLMFAFELQRRLDKAGHKTLSVAAHPGVSVTELGRHFSVFMQNLLRYTILPFMTHPPKDGAMPTVMAALGEDVKGGEYFGPTGFNEMKGAPGRAKSTSLARNEEVAAKLWEFTGDLVGYNYL